MCDLGKAFRTLSIIGVAITASPIQLGHLMMIRFGVFLKLKCFKNLFLFNNLIKI